MKRFEQKKRSSAGERRFSILLSVALCALILLLLFGGVEAFSGKAQQEQKRSLEEALQRTVVVCYASEGIYPPNLEYLEKYYSLSYDKELFFVDYQPVGENMMPEVTVILRKGDK